MATAETTFPDQSDLDYDYDTLRTTGVVLAAIMFVSGIVIALTHPVPKFQKQRYLLKLCRKYGKCRKTEGRLRGHTGLELSISGVPAGFPPFLLYLFKIMGFSLIKICKSRTKT